MSVKRARCAVCHSSQKLRASGTLGQHHLWIGRQYVGVCPGTGKTSQETFAEANELRRIMAGGKS